MFLDLFISLYTLALTILFVAIHLQKDKAYDETTLGRRSWWTEVFFLVITATAYMVPWYLGTTEALNRKAERPLSQGFQVATVAFTIGTAILPYVVSFLAPDFVTSDSWVNLSRMLQAMNVVLWIVWSFQIRRLVMEQTGMSISGLLTFFLGIFYVFYFVRKAYGPSNGITPTHDAITSPQAEA